MGTVLTSRKDRPCSLGPCRAGTPGSGSSTDLSRAARTCPGQHGPVLGRARPVHPRRPSSAVHPKTPSNRHKPCGQPVTPAYWVTLRRAQTRATRHAVRSTRVVMLDAARRQASRRSSRPGALSWKLFLSRKLLIRIARFFSVQKESSAIMALAEGTRCHTDPRGLLIPLGCPAMRYGRYLLPSSHRFPSGALAASRTTRFSFTSRENLRINSRDTALRGCSLSADRRLKGSRTGWRHAAPIRSWTPANYNMSCRHSTVFMHS